MKLEQIIKDKFKAAMKCDFKRAWLPKGWAVVKIEKFSKELAGEIRGKRKEK